MAEDTDAAGTAKKQRTDEAAADHPSQENTDSTEFLTEACFADEAGVGPLTLRHLHEAGFKRMTRVQRASLPVLLQGKDGLVAGKTGTGKTLAFLVPAVELLRRAGVDPAQRAISVLIISPTRELAMQTVKEAWMLAGGPRGDIKVGCVMGGRDFLAERQEMQDAPAIHILVCTVGRLLDHLKKDDALRTRLADLRMLILDEADTLMQTTFEQEMGEILTFLPPADRRQTLLFSATIPSTIPVEGLIREDYTLVDAVDKSDAITNVNATQQYLVVPLADTVRTIYSLLLHHTTTNARYKILVFFATARLTQFMSMLFTQVFHIPTLEIHSRRAQDKRTATSDDFRKQDNVILFSSDVSARGMDYEDVTFVLQVGRASNREQYIHRLGRTARAGKEGYGLLLLAPHDESFLAALHDLPILPTTAPAAHGDTPLPETMVEEWKRGVHRRGELKSRAVQAYQSWLGFYNSHKKQLDWDKERLVAEAALFAVECLKFAAPPAILHSIAKKMGLGDVSSLPTKK